MKKRTGALCAGLLALGMTGAAQATLIDRGNGMLYDDVLDITWLKDANWAHTSGYAQDNARDNGSGATNNIFADGRMGWDAAVAWASGLLYGGYDDWRLPIIAPANASFTFSNNGTATGGYGTTGSGYGTNTPVGGWGTPADADGIWSEMGWMLYHNLGNLGYCTPNDGDPSSCIKQPGWGITNTSTSDGVAIDYLQSYEYYWSGTEYAPNNAHVWYFRTGYGGQGSRTRNQEFYTWAVHSGDVAGVPEPSAILLMGLGLAGIGYRRHRSKKTA